MFTKANDTGKVFNPLIVARCHGLQGGDEIGSSMPDSETEDGLDT